jgi:hypothetical protein
MDNNVSIQIKNFNDKIRVMNQTQSKQIVLTAQEARNLHTEIYALLAQVADLVGRSATAPVTQDVVQISMDGGKF